MESLQPSTSTDLIAGVKYPEYNLKFFMSGNMGRAGEEEERLAVELECRLCSCHDAYVRDAKRWAGIASRKETGITKMLLDSGAFTAWSKGKRVDINHLIATYSDVMSFADHSKVKIWLINLDVIPGSIGVTASATDVDEAIKQSDINFNILVKEFGDCVVPVYHQNETEARLREVVSMANYICASPRNDLPEWTRVQWSEEVHQKIPAGTRTHGLATTGALMMSRVPWWSVDSAAWLYSGAMGKVDALDNNKWVSINISKESPDVYNQGKHYRNCDKHIQEVIDRRAAFHGIDVAKLQDDHMARKLFNGLEIIEWLKTFKFEPKQYQPSLFEL